MGLSGGNGELRQGELLAQLVEEMRGLRTELRAGQELARVAHQAMVGRLDEMNARLDQTNARLERASSRLDQLVENTGAPWRDHEARLAGLAARSGAEASVSAAAGRARSAGAAPPARWPPSPRSARRTGG